jgi:hypothetical protein
LDTRSEGDHQLADEATFGPGLFGHQHVAQHGFRLFEDVISRFAQLNPALETAFEGAFATAAGVDLGFNGEQAGAVGQEFFGNCFSGFGGVTDASGRDGNAVVGEKLLGLKFVDVHKLEN